MSGGIRMREYKFRAWDSWWDKMYYFDFAKNIEATSDDELKGLWILHEEGSVYAIQDKIKIMQFTGLYDKNGKEIYEGDILKRASTIKQWKRELFEEIIGKVTIKIGMTYLVGKRKHGYSDEELKISNCKELLLSPDLFEVIGDIHSNPELLESGE